MAAKEANDRRRAEQLKQLQRQHEIQAAASQQQGKSPGTPTIPDYRLCSANSSADSALLESHLQVIGMSATLPNVDQVANWLDAVLYRTDFRPVQLRQHIKVGRSIKSANDQVVCELMVPDGWEIQDPDHVALLAKETIDVGLARIWGPMSTCALAFVAMHLLTYTCRACIAPYMAWHVC
eukprot:GHRR01037153.1.p2 GENE.GHRR01037153.1~~GHRR01037153.1.p2  ORF type:complete len:180 (+),score=50.43 GHRR01037153.1:1043-1582(+)